MISPNQAIRSSERAVWDIKQSRTRLFFFFLKNVLVVGSLDLPVRDSIHIGYYRAVLESSGCVVQGPFGLFSTLPSMALLLLSSRASVVEGAAGLDSSRCPVCVPIFIDRSRCPCVLAFFFDEIVFLHWDKTLLDHDDQPTRPLLSLSAHRCTRTHTASTVISSFTAAVGSEVIHPTRPMVHGSLWRSMHRRDQRSERCRLHLHARTV